MVAFGDIFGFFGPNQPVIDLAGNNVRAEGSAIMFMDDTVEDTVGGGALAHLQRGHQWLQGQGAEYNMSGIASDTNLGTGGPRGKYGIEMSAIRQDASIDGSTGGGQVLGHGIRTRANPENAAGTNIPVTAPNCGTGSRGMEWGLDNEGASGTLTVSPLNANQLIDGKFSHVVPAKERHTFHSDGGLNDYLIITYDALAGGTFAVSGAVDLSWAGGTGEVIDDDGVSIMVVRLSTGTVPLEDDVLTQGGVTAAVDEATTPIVVAPGNWSRTA